MRELSDQYHDLKNQQSRSRRKNELSTFGRFTLSVRRFLNGQTSKHKKNDDYKDYKIGFSNSRQTQAERRSFYKKLAFYAVWICSFIGLIWFIVHLLASGGSKQVKMNINDNDSLRNYMSKNFDDAKTKNRKTRRKPNYFLAEDSNPLNNPSDKALNEILIGMQIHQRKSRHLEDMLKDDAVNEVIHEHCTRSLPFKLTDDGHFTLNAHIQYALTSLVEQRRMPNFKADSVAVSKDGTIIDMTQKEGKKYRVKDIDYSYSCKFVQSIVKKSHDLRLNDQRKSFSVFAKTNSDIWNDAKDKFSSGNLNVDAYNLLSLAKAGGYKLHQADELISGLLKTHCQNVFDFMDAKSENNINPMMELTQSMMSILKQINGHTEIIMDDKDEIPAIDTQGHIVAVNEFGANKDNAIRDEHYATCGLIDKIVYYSNTDIESQVTRALIVLKETNLYSFENKMDILMEEHCSETVRKLEAVDAGYNNQNIYDAVFRGELLSFAAKVVANEFIGSTEFVITPQGGIVHADQLSANDASYECSIIRKIAEVDDHDAILQDGEEAFDEKQFNPNFDDALFKQEMDYIQEAESTKSDHDAVFDANLIFEQVQNGNKQNLRRITMRLMYWHHSEDFDHLSESQVQKIIAETEQFITLLGNHELEIPEWPENFIAFIDTNAATVKVGEFPKSDVGKELKPGQIKSKLLNAIFKVFVENKNAERAEIKSGLEKKKEEMRRRRDARDARRKERKRKRRERNGKADDDDDDDEAEEREKEKEKLKRRSADRKRKRQREREEEKEDEDDDDDDEEAERKAAKKRREKNAEKRKREKEREEKKKQRDAKRKKTRNDDDDDDDEEEEMSEKELKRYVELIWRDIKEQDKVGEIQHDIWKDLDDHCKFDGLSSGSIRNVKRNVVRMVSDIQDGSEDSMEKAVIIKDDGSIKSMNDVDGTKHFVNCPYVTQLLSFK